jgi:hypothetical protein
MLHAKTRETKGEAHRSGTGARFAAEPSKATAFALEAGPTPTRPRFPGGRTSVQHRLHALTTLQGARGNQAVLRMLENAEPRDGVPQRKCACGGSAGSTGECAECRQNKANIFSQQHGDSLSAFTGEDIQAKLAMGQAGDQYEQEADRVADDVMRMSDRSAAAQAIHPFSFSSGSNCRRAPDRVSNIGGGDLSSIVARGTSGGGHALDPETRSFMEARFGLDFGHVRMHTDSAAARSARAINALAYTVGDDIVFAQGTYAPRNSAGRRLIAHELAHTVQQGGVIVPSRSARQADNPLQRSCQGNCGRPSIFIQRLAGDADSGFGVYDNAGPDEARAALSGAIGEENLRILEEFAYADQSKEGEIAAMRAPDPRYSGITHRASQLSVMAAGPAVIVGISAAIILCAVGWFYYTLNKYGGSKSDKWEHCFCSCKIASYCGAGIPVVGSVISLLIGGSKEVADWIGDHFGIPMQAEWEDFVADSEGAFLCGIGGVFSGSCYNCCEEKRGGK